jgi:Skp family chaperone for outer membrane proteins
MARPALAFLASMAMLASMATPSAAQGPAGVVNLRYCMS